MRRRNGVESGFTLIELMVVVAIIAILTALAIPTFVGFRKNAQDRSAQSDLRNVLTFAKGYLVDSKDFPTSPQLAPEAPAYTLTIDPDAGISVRRQAGADKRLCLETQSESGTYWAIHHFELSTGVSGTEFGKNSATVWGGGACTAPPASATGTWRGVSFP